MRSKTIPKRTIRDSVFTALASKKPYLLQIFQALHPEDTTTTADNLQNVTLRNVLVDGQYNDLGFEANGKTIILIEAQTQWSDNIILRIMLYYLRTLDEKQERDKNSLFSRKALPLLKPEFYIVYTGDKTDIPEYISFTETYFPGQQSDIEARARVIRQPGKDNILSQYVSFNKVYSEQLKRTGRKQETIENTIRICQQEGYLADFLNDHQNEVRKIMSALFDEEVILRNYMAEVVAEEREDARADERREMAREMLRAGEPRTKIVQFTKLSDRELDELQQGSVKPS